MTCKMKSRFVALSLCLMGFSFVPVLGQIGIPSHSIVNPDSVSHNFYERETVKGNTITYKIDHSYPMLYRIGNASNTRLGELMSLKDGSTPTEPVDREGFGNHVFESRLSGFSEDFHPRRDSSVGTE